MNTFIITGYIIPLIISLFLIFLEIKKKINDPNSKETLGNYALPIIITFFPPFNIIIVLTYIVLFIQDMKIWKTPVNQLFKKEK